MGGVGSNGDTITVGGGADTVHAGNSSTVTVGAAVTGADDITVGLVSTVTIAAGASVAVTVHLGAQSTLNLGAVAGGTEIVDVSATFAGATSSGSYSFTTINGAAHGTGQSIAFDPGGTVETFTSAATNVATAVNLSNALDMAARNAGNVSGPGHATAEWFQFGGNTYIIDAFGSATSHTGTVSSDAMQVTDIVVKLAGLINLTGDTFGTGHTLTI